MKRRRWQVLADLANAQGWSRLAEIGVLKGQTSAYLLKHCPRLEMLLVDHWTPGDPSRDLPEHKKKGPGDHGYRSYARHDLASYRRQVEALAMAYPGRATIMPMPSIEAADQVEDGSLCAAFLDGDHTTDGVIADIRAWAPKIAPGGVLCGHDWNLEAVAIALAAMVPGYTKCDDSVWWLPVDAGEVKL
jgi:hypothetical protein